MAGKRCPAASEELDNSVVHPALSKILRVHMRFPRAKREPGGSSQHGGLNFLGTVAKFLRKTVSRAAIVALRTFFPHSSHPRRWSLTENGDDSAIGIMRSWDERGGRERERESRATLPRLFVLVLRHNHNNEPDHPGFPIWLRPLKSARALFLYSFPSPPLTSLHSSLSLSFRALARSFTPVGVE